MQVPDNHQAHQCLSPQHRPVSPPVSPITVGCLPEFMPSPLDLHDKAGDDAPDNSSPLLMVRRDITAAGSNLGKQLAACVAQFDSQFDDADVVR